jgi:uncharacterized protein
VERRLRRRDFIGAGLTGAGALALGPGFWRQALAAPAVPGPGPYGPLQAADANGLMLPPGFRSRLIARANELVPGTAYPWHIFPDGQATFSTPDDGWILVSNSESVAASGAGSSAIRFRADGSIASAYRILAGTNTNCAGGPTPWGAWLSCEEYDFGHVWECDPTGASPALIRPALGTFNHEAACVDPVERRLYLTEDEPDGALYRFTPRGYPDLSDGLLEVAVAGQSATTLSWARVPDPSALGGATRQQVQGTRRFDGGEGIWYDSGTVYFTTKGDNVVWAYETRTRTLDKVYDGAATPSAPLRGVDNITVTSAGDVYVCEDGGDMEIVMITPDRVVAPFCKLTGPAAESSEMAGVILDPSATRMYFSSQRAFGLGATYEVTGPFRASAVSSAPPAGDRRPRAGASWLRVTVRRAIGMRRLLGSGLLVIVRVPGPATLDVGLRTPDLRTGPGKRESSRRPRTVVLARLRRRLRRGGRHTVRLRLGARAAARLRGRRGVTATVTVQARLGGGRVAVAARPLRIGLPARPRTGPRR